MDSKTSIVQILEKADYRKQHLVKLPNDLPLPPLGESQVIIRSSTISLTVNNFTYARLGDALGWWKVWRSPPSLPEPYTDTSKYGRVSAWGYSTVIGSTIPSLPEGTKLFGYLPIATLPEVLNLEESADVSGHFIETSSHRQHVFALYNRYLKLPSVGLTSDNEHSMALDSLMLGLFEAAFNLNRHCLSWDPARPPVEPGPGIPSNPAWTPQNANLKDTIVIILAASGKTALSFAYNLKHNRPSSHKPSKTIAVGSESSLQFLKFTNLHDDTLLYSSIHDTNPNTISTLGITLDSKIALFDFGARGDSATEWDEILSKHTTTPLTLVAIGSDPEPVDASVTDSRLSKNGPQGWVQANASGIRDLAMGMLGEKAYFEEFGREWEGFKRGGGVDGLEVEWGEGMEGVGEGWERLVAGTVGPRKGLVFNL